MQTFTIEDVLSEIRLKSEEQTHLQRPNRKSQLDSLNHIHIRKMIDIYTKQRV